MCTGSIHVPHRVAQKTERLKVQTIPSMGSMKGYYPVKGDAKLVCVRGSQEAVIKTVHFEPGLARDMVKTWEGKRNVKVMLRHVPYADQVRFPDGRIVMLTNLQRDVRIDIGVPVKKRVPKPKSAGMTAVDRAMREALALPPDPKPEGEEADAPKPAEPAPEREPAPASDAPAARRRR